MLSSLSSFFLGRLSWKCQAATLFLALFIVTTSSAQPLSGGLDSSSLKGIDIAHSGPLFVYLLDRTESMANSVRSTGNSRCTDSRNAALDDLREIFQVWPDAGVAVWTFDGTDFTQRTDGFTDNVEETLGALVKLDPDSCLGEGKMVDALCGAIDKLLVQAGSSVSDVNIVLSSDGNEIGSTGRCSGPGSQSDVAPFTEDSWPFLVQESLGNSGVTLSTRLWRNAESEAGDSKLLSKATDSEASIFRELTTLSGGVYSEAFDDVSSFASSIFLIFADGFEPNTEAPLSDRFVLSIAFSGRGTGRVSSIPTALDCENQCDALLPEGAQINLAALPDTDAAFTGWSGDCTGVTDCQVIVTEDQQVTANFDRFDRELRVSLSASATSVFSGEFVTIFWSVENFKDNLTVCEATGGTAEWVADIMASPAGGSGAYSLDSETTFTLQCDQLIESVTVSVTPRLGPDGFPIPPAFCGAPPSGRALPFNIFRDFTANPPDGQPKVSFAGVWGPYPGDEVATIFVPVNQYVALPFFANLPPDTLWDMTWLGGPSNGNATQVSISRCPGDFSGIGYTSEFCKINSAAEGSTILTITDMETFACPLMSGAEEVYYLNIRHAFANGQNACLDGFTCGFLAAPRRLN